MTLNTERNVVRYISPGKKIRNNWYSLKQYCLCYIKANQYIEWISFYFNSVFRKYAAEYANDALRLFLLNILS
jgi:hypothetical protein